MAYTEYLLIELIKLSQNQMVVADMQLPPELAKELTTYDRVACLLADPEL